MWQRWSIPPYSSDLAAADFSYSLDWNRLLKGRRFCDATIIIKNATEELKRPPQNGFQNVFNTFTVAGVNCVIA